MDYDYIIIGGGISGLNTLYRLYKEGYNVVLFERTNRLGGRILTYKTIVNKQEISYESGAGRISENHKLTLDLIKELGLEDKLYEISNEKTYYIDRKFYNSETELEKNLLKPGETIAKLWEKVINYGKTNKDFAMKTNIIGIMSKVLSKTQMEILIKSFGYYSELVDYNGYNAIISIERDFLASKYYILKGGLEQIIVELEKLIPKELINLNTNIDKIVKTTDGYIVKSGKNEWKAKGVITAVNYSDLIKLSERKLAKVVKPEHLLRIYAIFPKQNGKVWFDGMLKTITDLPIKYIIPIDYESGLTMISYTDNKYSDYWTNKETIRKIIIEIMKQLKEIFPEKDIPNPIYFRLHDWKEGVNYFKPGVNSQEFQEELIGKFEENLYYIGEIFSNYQAWIEGALETSQVAIDNIVEKNPKGSRWLSWMPTFSLDFAWIFPKSELWDYKLPISSKLKIITKEELGKHNKKTDAWIAVDGLVMNISKFIDKHPGGLAIMNGVGRDATELFNNNSFHSKEIKKNIFPKYIIGRLE